MTGRIPTANELFFTPAPQDHAQVEALERRFFETLELANGTWKTTSRRRLDDLNALVLRHLPSRRPLHVMDVAVSSGVSTLEWLESLEQAGIDCQLTAGDVAVEAFLISPRAGLRALIDRSGHVLQYEAGGKAVLPTRKRQIVRNLVSVALLRACAWLIAPTLRRRRGDEGRHWAASWKAVRLVSPLLPARVNVIEDDILTNTAHAQRFDVLRAANILNRSYFSDSVLRQMLENLRNRLRVGGTFIVCSSTRAGENHGTIFTVGENNRLQVAARLGHGSDIETLALDLGSRV